jgi:polysaccharide biosynthesis transport protein
MELKFIINALFRKKWVIIACTTAAIIAALIFVLTKQKLYLSAAQYSTGFTMKQAVKIREDEGFNFFEIDQRFKNVIQTFKSPVVIGMLSYDLMLHDLQEKRPFTILTEKQKKTAAYMGVNPQQAIKMLKQKHASLELLKAYDPEEQKVYELIKLYQYDNETINSRLDVGQITGTDFLNILYRSENPELSAHVVNTIGKEFFRFFTSINEDRSGQSVSKLDSLAQLKKKELEVKTKVLQEFKAGFGTPDVKDKATGAMEMVKEYSTNLAREESKLNAAKAELNAVNQQLTNLDATSTGVNNYPEIIRLQSENRELARENPDDPKIKSNIDRILLLQNATSRSLSRADILKKRDELTGRKLSLEGEIIAATQTVNNYQAQINRYASISSSGGGADVVEQALKDDMDQATKDYQFYKSKLEAANDINVAPDINFKQTLLGQPAIKPEPGNSKLILALSAIAAFGFSAFVIIILDFLDTSLRAPSIFHKLVKMKLLTPVNKVSFKEKDVEACFNLNQEERLVEENMFIENVRKLRYEIESSGKKIFLFTSTKAAEGKTTIIQALANSFSLSRKKVLIIDANFSNNSLTEKYNAKPLLDQFSVNGERNASDKFRNITSSTSIHNVDIVGCKEGNFSPSEILPKNNLLEHVRSLADDYDYVFLEGAALNIHADSKELLKYVDGVVPVFSSRSVIKQIDKESIHFLRNSDKLVGGVLNAVEEENIDL